MILICTPDERLGRGLRKTIRRRVTFVTAGGRTTLYDRCVEMAAELRPAALLLDVRAGGTGGRAVERVPWVLRASPLTAVVVMTIGPSAAEVEEIRRLHRHQKPLRRKLPLRCHRPSSLQQCNPPVIL